MDKILSKDPYYVRKFYKIIEKNCDLDLSVADKSILLSHLKKANHEGFIELWYDAFNFLWSMGYKSKKLENLIKDSKKRENYWARVFESF